MNQLKKYSLIGFLFVVITGTLGHFVYDWSSQNYVAGLFFPVNESTWEHMKLIYFPALLYSFYMEKRLQKEYPCIRFALSSGILAGTAFIPVFFYVYSGIWGRNYFVFDILTFLLSAAIVFVVTYRFSQSCRAQKYSAALRAFVWILFLGFLLFSYFPPSIGLFVSPV